MLGRLAACLLGSRYSGCGDQRIASLARGAASCGARRLLLLLLLLLVLPRCRRVGGSACVVPPLQVLLPAIAAAAEVEQRDVEVGPQLEPVRLGLVKGCQGSSQVVGFCGLVDGHAGLQQRGQGGVTERWVQGMDSHSGTFGV